MIEPSRPTWDERQRMKRQGKKRGGAAHDVKCDVCGQFILFNDLVEGRAVHRMITPDSHRSHEEWESLCRNHFNQ